jgi:hypothetical protein
VARWEADCSHAELAERMEHADDRAGKQIASAMSRTYTADGHGGPWRTIVPAHTRRTDKPHLVVSRGQ